MGIEMCNIKSIPTFGLQVNDAFGVALLLQSIFFLTCLVNTTHLFISLGNDDDHYNYQVLEMIEIALSCINCIAFPSLVLAGFIWLQREMALRIWIIMGASVDLTLILIVTYLDGTDVNVTSITIVSLIVFIFAEIMFHGYIYLMSWNAWSQVAQGIELRGYTQGFLYLFKYYQNEFKRTAIILLVVELWWNLFSTLSIDLGMELLEQSESLDKNDILIPRPIIPLRVTRFIIAALGLVFVNKEKYSWLKFGWLPCQLASIVMGIIVLILVFTISDDPSKHVRTIPLFAVESLIHFGLNSILFYFVFKFTLYTPINPRPLVAAEAD